MSDEQKRPKIAPTASPGGSFTSREKILGDIQEEKIRELENAQADAKKAKAEADEAERIKAIDKLLPPDVSASFGELPYAIFKERYQTVWNQVSEKTHLTRGWCDYTFEAAPNLQATIRTLKSKEMKFLRRFTPTTDPAENPAAYMDEDSLFRNARFEIAVTTFAGTHRPAVEIPKKRVHTEKDVEEWMNSKPVADRFDWVGDLPEELTDTIAGIFMDLSLAYRFALQENLKNQFAPLSRS